MREHSASDLHRALWMGCCAILAGLWLTVGFGQAQAAAFPPAFVVAGVPVEATPQGAVSAREVARGRGAVEGLHRLLQRLTAPADWSRLPNPDTQAAIDLIADMEVTDEHSSAAHYVATYTFRFNPKGVRQLLDTAGVTYTELSSKPVIVVPVLKLDGESHLWDDPNPWRDAWNAISGQKGLVPWVVPAGDLGDVAAFDLPDALQPKPARLQTLSQHYDDGDVVIATASRSGAHLDITVARYSAGGGTPQVASTAVDGGAGDGLLYQAGVAAASQLLENQWKGQSLAPAATTGDGTIEVSVPVAGPADWGTVQDRLTRVPTVRAVNVELMTRSEVRLKLTTAGDQSLLKIALAQQDLVLTAGQPFATLSARASAIGPTP